jgi:cephalosporin hydroxylase
MACRAHLAIRTTARYVCCMFKRMKRRLSWSLSSGPLRQEVIDAFHTLWYYSPSTWRQSTWFGFPIQQHPLDLQLYQEVIARTRPRRIVQTGVNEGGSLLFLAHMLDALGEPDALVIGVDIRLTPKARTLDHPRIRTIEGDSISSAVVSHVSDLVGPSAHVLVSLDSDHSAAHVKGELRAYSGLVSVGSYLVVEDTNLNGRPVVPGFGPGPLDAANEFLNAHPEFARDDALWSRNLLSHHAGGWLKRLSNSGTR